MFATLIWLFVAFVLYRAVMIFADGVSSNKVPSVSVPTEVEKAKRDMYEGPYESLDPGKYYMPCNVWHSNNFDL